MLKSVVGGLIPAVFVVSACATAIAQPLFATSGEYARLGYQNEARDNPVARLQDALQSGKLQLSYSEVRGYFDALLDALDIDPDSQMLVFSATSLQKTLISRKTPRGLFYNDDTYLGLVQHSTIVEVLTMDDKLGIVFYTFDNTKGTTKYFQRADQTCLVCHDSQGVPGFGVPMLRALSIVFSADDVPLKIFSGNGIVGDETPLKDRWGGWYVTGRHGVQPHLGNLILDDPDDLDTLDDHRVWNLETLKALSD